MSHFYPYNYLVWFEDDLTPHLDMSKPTGDQVLAQARFAVGSQLVVLRDGQVSRWAGHRPDRRTAVGVDTQRRQLWLAVFQHASGTLVAETLARAGANDAALLDGGDSSTMYLAPTSAPVRTGTLQGGLRPVPTFLGIRARALEQARRGVAGEKGLRDAPELGDIRKQND